MPGLWRQLRQLWHDYQNFGVKELAALKKHNAEMRVKVEEVRARNRALDKLLEEQTLAALRSAVAQANSAREGMEADAKQAAELAERLSEVLTRNMEADLAQNHVASLQRAAAAVIAKSSPPEGGQASAAAPPPPLPQPESRVGSGDRGSGGA